MIATLTEIKSFINDSEHDSFINLNIPIIDQTICDYCNNDFIDKNYDYINSSSVVFNSNNNSIELSNIGNEKLLSGDSIRVYKSLRNNQTFTIDTVNTDSLILNSIDTIIEEDEGESVYIVKLNYPKPLKMVAAKMIKHLIGELDSDITSGALSETIDDYSITFENYYQGFPKSIMSSLNTYRQLYKIDLFNCSRSEVI